jgi:hypothetical protein
VRRNNGTKEEIVHYNYLKPYQIRPVKKPKSRNPPKKNGIGHPALDTSEDSESDSREEEMQLERRYPEIAAGLEHFISKRYLNGAS